MQRIKSGAASAWRPYELRSCRVRSPPGWWAGLSRGMVVTLTAQLAGLYFGRYGLKLNPLLLLRGLSGAQTFTAGLAAVEEKSDSLIAVLGYSGAVPVAHILLTTLGTLIVLFTAP
jgi:uncharacterized transporter YbjL